MGYTVLSNSFMESLFKKKHTKLWRSLLIMAYCRGGDQRQNRSCYKWSSIIHSKVFSSPVLPSTWNYPPSESYHFKCRHWFPRVVCLLALFCFVFYWSYREGGRGKWEEGEPHPCEEHQTVASHTDLKPRYVPWVEFEPEIFWCRGWLAPTNWAAQAGLPEFLLIV